MNQMFEMSKVFGVSFFVVASLVISAESGASIVKRDVDFANLNKFNNDLLMMSQLGGELNLQGQRRSDQPEPDSGLSQRAASFGNAQAPLIQTPSIFRKDPVAISPVSSTTPTPATTPGITPTPACSHPKDLTCNKNTTVSVATRGVVK